MSRETLLVPVRYPLTDPSVETVAHAADLAAEFDDASLYVLHVNLIHKGESVTPNELRAAVERELESPPSASHNVTNAFLLDEAILNETAQVGADYVVIGRTLRGRLRQLVVDRLNLGVDLASVLDDHLDAELVVV